MNLGEQIVGYLGGPEHAESELSELSESSLLDGSCFVMAQIDQFWLVESTSKQKR